MIKIDDNFYLDESYLDFDYSRSRGPGGQNVNKVNTAARLSFEVKDCRQLKPPVKKRLMQLAGRRINQEGKLIIQSDTYRTQQRNRTECIDRLKKLLQKALIAPKKRRPTNPSRASVEKRLQNKKHRSKIKSLRRKPIKEE